jgi:hypothetical protein
MIRLWSPLPYAHYSALHFQNYLNVQALSNNNPSDRGLNAAKYGWNLHLLFQRFPEIGQTHTTGAEIPISYPFMALDLLM